MNTPTATRLRLDAQRTVLAADPAPELVLAVGVMDLAGRLFRHDPPTPFEMEQAIDAVEDALSSSGLRQSERGDLVTSDPLLQAWVSAGSLQGDGVRLTRDDVEAI